MRGRPSPCVVDGRMAPRGGPQGWWVVGLPCKAGGARGLLLGYAGWLECSWAASICDAAGGCAESLQPARAHWSGARPRHGRPCSRGRDTGHE